MAISKLLEEIGLTKNEVKVYLSLFDLGLTTTTAIIKKTGINTSKVYESLERLLKKGLVSYVIIKNKKHWKTENPDRIKNFLQTQKKSIEQKEKELIKVLPELKIKKKPEVTETAIFEWVAGIKTSREQVLEELKKGDTFYLILSAVPPEEKIEAYWLDFQKRRAKKGIKCRYIFNENLRELAKERLKIPLTNGKFIKSEIMAPAWIEIYKDFVGIGTLTEKPIIFKIKNPEIAKSFLGYFESLWKIAKP